MTIKRTTNKKEIFVIGKEWRPRALVRAQLIEEGYDVVGLEEIDEAVVLLKKKLSWPFLIIFDSAGRGLSKDTVEALRELAGKVRVLLCIGAYDTTGLDLSGLDLMIRPFSIKSLIDKVNEISQHGD